MQNCALYMLDRTGLVVSWSSGNERVLGYRSDEVLGRHFSLFYPDDDTTRDEPMAHLRAADASGQHEEEGWRVRKDATQFWASALVTPIRDVSAQLLGFVNVTHDLTEQNALADAVREGEERLRGFLDHSPTWMFIKDAEGRYLLVNKVFANVHGLAESEILGKSDFELFPRGHAARFWSYDSRVLDTGEIVDYELTPQTSVMPRYSVGRKFPLRNRHGRIYAVGGVATDITERATLRETQTELARVARISSLGALAASIAHEVNQPLSGIITNANTCLRMLAADPPNVDGARETARRTIRDGNRAADVISRLRALYDKKDTATESVDLNEAAREVIALSLGEPQSSRVLLQQEFAGDLPPVKGDRVQLQQVILNLLLNAEDAMRGVDDRPRLLVIRTKLVEDDHVRLTVQDAGVAFDPQSVNRLFEAFYTTKSGGMGIGLSVSRSIIESHQGRLWAEPNDGPGATFAFSIPRWAEGVEGGHSPGVI